MAWIVLRRKGMEKIPAEGAVAGAEAGIVEAAVASEVKVAVVARSLLPRDGVVVGADPETDIDCEL